MYFPSGSSQVSEVSEESLGSEAPESLQVHQPAPAPAPSPLAQAAVL